MRTIAIIIIGFALLFSFFNETNAEMECCLCEATAGQHEHIRYSPIPCNCFDQGRHAKTGIMGYCQSKCYKLNPQGRSIGREECQRHVHHLDVEHENSEFCANFLFITEWNCVKRN